MNKIVQELLILKEYGKKYKELILDKKSKKELKKINNSINNIPIEIVELVKNFVKLDIEFKIYGKRLELTSINGKIFSPDYIKDKRWRGYWLKATGMDCDLFTNWLISAIEYEEYHYSNLEDIYLEAHPKEKYVPYSIKMANVMFYKYYNKCIIISS